jgi:hypothetical protein
MHSYLKLGGSMYAIGLWLPNAEGRTSFNKMFVVQGWGAACTAVNVLNGGHGLAMPRFIREYGQAEEEEEE